MRLRAGAIPSRGGNKQRSGHVDALLSKGAHYSRAGFQSADPRELGADYFAAALLMPERPFKNGIDDHPAGLAGITA